jgi:hypothetical protein
MLFLLLIVGLVSADFYDTTCQKLKCSKAEMKYVNYAKMLSAGYHECLSTFVDFAPNGTILYSTSFNSTVNTYYDASTGSVHSDYVDATGANVTIDEYCDGHGNVCIEIDDASNSGFYTESKDQNREGLGTAWRSIGFYTKGAKKEIRGFQQLVPTKDGDILHLTMLDENGKLDYSMYQTCKKIN